MKIEMIVEKTRTGYSAYATKGMTFTMGKDLEELKKNILEIINVSLEDRGKTARWIIVKLLWIFRNFFHSIKSLMPKPSQKELA